jgi:hypothetical protein
LQVSNSRNEDTILKYFVQIFGLNLQPIHSSSLWKTVCINDKFVHLCFIQLEVATKEREMEREIWFRWLQMMAKDIPEANWAAYRHESYMLVIKYLHRDSGSDSVSASLAPQGPVQQPTFTPCLNNSSPLYVPYAATCTNLHISSASCTPTACSATTSSASVLGKALNQQAGE